MSAQRYHPPDQRYAPSEDTRFPPRDRSPPRYGGDRFPSNNSYRPGYQNRSDDPRDSGPPPVNRDVPRGPRASFDTPRGSAPFALAPSRGRGFTGRGDYRGSFRGGDASRDSRDLALDDRDRSWRDRDLDRRDRRPSSPGRPRPAEFRDFREPQPPPASREPEFVRRGSIRDPPVVGAVAHESRRDPFAFRGRGHPGRGRGRGDWEGRGRELFVEERPLPPRSRSPTRDYKSDREIPKIRGNLEIRDERRMDGREDRSVDRDRTFDKFNKERSPFRNESRRPSISTTSPSSSRPLSPALGQGRSTSNIGRPFNEANRNPSSLRRASHHSTSVERWDDRREVFNVESQDGRDRQDSRPSSPPPAIQVPAFGWNVWKAPTEPKAMKQSVPVNAPTGPKLIPPIGPKTERPIEEPGFSDRRLGTRPDIRDQQAIQPPRTPANIHPQRLNRMQGQPGISSPPTSPTFIAPSGPRTIGVSVSPKLLGANIPTGPKVDRNQQPPPPWTPTAPVPSLVRQWQRPGSFGHPGKPGGLVPAKREFGGEERKHDFSNARRTKPSDSMGNSSFIIGDNDANHPISSTWGDAFEYESLDRTHQLGQNAPQVEHATDHDEGEGLMELDDDDFEKKELRFQREKVRLESELVDLSSSRLRGSRPLNELAHLACISLSTLPNSSDRRETQKRNEHAVLGTGQLAIPKVETFNQDGIAVRKHFAPTEPPPITTYEIKSLPFLNRAPQTPLEESDICKQNVEQNSAFGADFEFVLRERLAAKQETEIDRENTYGDLYLPWISQVEHADKESKEQTPMEEYPEPTPAIPVAEPSAILASATEGRRRGGVSEYDIERVLQESVETAKSETARRKKLELSARIDYDKEAIASVQKDFADRDQHDFIDTTGQIVASQSIHCWNLEAPLDIVSQPDHELLVKHFREHPKKWGKIATSVNHDGGANISYKDCINHYYATKWNQEYKEKRSDKRRTKGQKSRLRVTTKSKTNALISNLGDVRGDPYEGEDVGSGGVPVTDSGRPRRAAAPIFGEKEAEEQLPATTTPAKRGLKGNEPANPNNEKPARRGRGSTRDRGVGRKHRIQPSSRTRSTSPEKMDIDIPKRPVTDARQSNGIPVSEFDISAALTAMDSSITSQPGEVSASMHGNAASLDGTSMTPQQPRSGPSSYWSVQEVNAFPVYLSHYGTDWHSIAQRMDTKTGTMVKNYYFRLISNSGRPELEEMVKIADERRQRGELVGPIVPPPISTRRRGESSQQSAPRPLAPNSEASDIKDGSPPYRANAAAQQGQTEARAPHSYSLVPPRLSGHGHSTSVEIGLNGSEQNLQARRNEQSSLHSHVTTHQGPTAQSSRTAPDYDGQARPGASSNIPHAHARQFPDGSSPAELHTLASSTPRYYQASPQRQGARDTGAQRPTNMKMTEFKERQYPHPMDPPSHRPSFLSQSGQLNQQRTTSPPRYGEVRRSRPSSPVKEQTRSYPTSQPSSQTPPVAKRTSNISALLNPDNETRRPNNATSHTPPSHLRTATPPASLYPPRSTSQSDRDRQYTDPERSMTYPAYSFGPQTTAPARPYSGIGYREHQSSAQDMARQDWQMPPSFAPLTSSNQQVQRAHLMDRQGSSSSMDFQRTSVQAFGSRPGPSPPPSLGFSNPPSHVQQQGNQASSHSNHSQQSSSYSQNPGNQQSFGRNSSVDYGGTPQRQVTSSQRQSGFEPMSGRSESEYGSKQESSPARAKDTQVGRERDSQTRSNLRPDSFMMHGSGNYRQGGNPFRQQANPPRQTEQHERGQQYGPVQDEQKKPTTPNPPQAHPGRGPPEQPPPRRN